MVKNLIKIEDFNGDHNTYEIKKLRYNIHVTENRSINEKYDVKVSFDVIIDFFCSEFVSSPFYISKTVYKSEINKFFTELQKNYSEYYKKAVIKSELRLAKVFFYRSPSLSSLKLCKNHIIDNSNYDEIEKDFVIYLASDSVELNELNKIVGNKLFPPSAIDKLIDIFPIGKLFSVAKLLDLADAKILKRFEGTPYYNQYLLIDAFTLNDILLAIKNNNENYSFPNKILLMYQDIIENECLLNKNETSKSILKRLYYLIDNIESDFI